MTWWWSEVCDVGLVCLAFAFVPNSCRTLSSRWPVNQMKKKWNCHTKNPSLDTTAAISSAVGNITRKASTGDCLAQWKRRQRGNETERWWTRKNTSLSCATNRERERERKEVLSWLSNDRSTRVRSNSLSSSFLVDFHSITTNQFHSNRVLLDRRNTCDFFQCNLFSHNFWRRLQKLEMEWRR